MKLPAIITRKKKLSAATARRSRALTLPDGMDYEEMSEPNMKLSRALLIVLVLHIVAVAGIVAFNTIKTREDLPEVTEVQASSESAVTPGIAATAAPNEVAKAATQPETKVAEAPAKPAATAARSSVKDSGKTYTVVKGDNPVTIARHLKVSEADLLELNQITDPRRLQINQKLKIPERRTASKTESD